MQAPPQAAAGTSLFEVAIEVDAAGHAPPHWPQATVTCAVWAGTADEAVQQAQADLQRDGYTLRAPRPRATPLDPATWDDYIQARWPAQRGRVPAQAELAAQACAGRIVPLGFYPHD